MWRVLAPDRESAFHNNFFENGEKITGNAEKKNIYSSFSNQEMLLAKNFASKYVLQ